MRPSHLPRGTVNVVFSNILSLPYDALIMFFETTLKLYLLPGINPEICTVVFVKLTLLGVNSNCLSQLGIQPISYLKDFGSPPSFKGRSQLRKTVLRGRLGLVWRLRTFEGKPAKQRKVMGLFCLRTIYSYALYSYSRIFSCHQNLSFAHVLIASLVALKAH
jgi:hypothetical protein